MSGIFDIRSDYELFLSIKRRYEMYQSGRTRSTEDILYVIMGLNHLREWIAPGYEYKTPSKNAAE